MHHYTKVESGNAHGKLLATYSHWRSRAQEGGVIAWAWITDPKVYQCPNDGVHAGGGSGGIA